MRRVRAEGAMGGGGGAMGSGGDEDAAQGRQQAAQGVQEEAQGLRRQREGSGGSLLCPFLRFLEMILECCAEAALELGIAKLSTRGSRRASARVNIASQELLKGSSEPSESLSAPAAGHTYSVQTAPSCCAELRERGTEITETV
jgi:hypothetical protein